MSTNNNIMLFLCNEDTSSIGTFQVALKLSTSHASSPSYNEEMTGYMRLVPSNVYRSIYSINERYRVQSLDSI